MQLSDEQVLFFHDNGFLLIESLFTKEETDLMLKEMSEVIKEDCPRRILEKNESVRSFFAPNFSNETFSKVHRHQKIVDPVSQLLSGEIYLHQSKINTKAAMLGDWWEWHQDFTYWHRDDGMREPNVLTAMIFLNHVTEFNGPLFLIPGSHKEGIADNSEKKNKTSDDSWYDDYVESTSYMTSLTSDLKYKLKQDTVANWISKNGIYSGKGPVGSVLFFHGNVFHASSNNLSPWDRHTYLLTYNNVNNRLPDIRNPRPEFISMRDFEPIKPITTIF